MEHFPLQLKLLATLRFQILNTKSPHREHLSLFALSIAVVHVFVRKIWALLCTDSWLFFIYICPGDFKRRLPRTPSTGTMSSADDLDEREPPSPSDNGKACVRVFYVPPPSGRCMLMCIPILALCLPWQPVSVSIYVTGKLNKGGTNSELERERKTAAHII